MKQTPLFDLHRTQGAKMASFAGWDMPLWYDSVMSEHRAVRSSVGVFDVSHMGRIELMGKDAGHVLNHLATSSVARLPIGQMQYALVCNDKGGILDDIMIYRLSDLRFLICVNASNLEKMDHWVRRHVDSEMDVAVTDLSNEVSQLAVQGPRSRECLMSITEDDLRALKIRHCAEISLAGVPMIISRSGYTGELGFELYLPANHAPRIWKALLENDRRFPVRPCGLACRDTLRLEMGYPLYGQDLDETVTPIEAGLEFAIDQEKGTFVGNSVLSHQQEEGVDRKRTGFELLERGVPRHGYKIFSGSREIGSVSSGNHSPSLNRGIGMGYLPPEYAGIGREISIHIRDRYIPARVVKMPFYKRVNTKP